MNTLENYEPRNVLKHFEQISRIPRESHNEKAVSDYIVNFAKAAGLFAVSDELNNVIVKKPAAPGYENAPTVIIQGHLDMVCEKTKESFHDFSRDPIELIIDGGFIHANNTTLGGDNGVAVAYAMALMEATDIPHPALEFVLTSCEETGMDGAKTVDPNLLSGSMLINIDSEEEGIFLASCAGGIKAVSNFPIDRVELPHGFSPYSLSVTGLIGGHSGLEIVKERGNSLIILARILESVMKKHTVYADSASGGAKDNVIPREAAIILYINKKDEINVTSIIKECESNLKNEYSLSDPGVSLCFSPSEAKYSKAVSAESLKKITNALLIIPNGISAMSVHIPGLVESSSNIGVLELGEDEAVFTASIRSSVKSRKYDLLDRMKIASELCGGSVEVISEYPAWEYNPDSKLRALFTETFTEMFNLPASVEAVHAGLECGIFAEKLGGIDMIAYGPNMSGIHSPDEKLSISSLKRTWELTLAVLAKIQ